MLRKYYGCELVNLTGTVVKVELISIFTTAVFECWNVCDKYTWDNAGYLKQLPIDQTPISEDHWSDLRQISCHGRNYSQPYFSKEISQVITAAMVLAPISVEKIVCE